MAITTVSSHVVSVNAIQGTLIADNAITAVHIATNAVSGTLIADNAVTATHIAQNTITVTQLADDAVEADKIADGVITTNHLNKAMISSQTEVTPVAGDFVLIGDTSDSNNLKKTPISGITALATVSGISSSADATAITIDSSERVGIGTTSPDGLLHISSGNSGDAIVIIEADEDNNDEADNPQLWFKADGDITEAAIRQADNELQFISNVSVEGGFTFFTGTSDNTGTTDPATGATEKVKIRTDGNVGIGDNDPAYKLSVSGTGGTRMMVENTDTNWAAVDIRAGGNQSNYIFFKDDSAERARIQVLDTNDVAFSTGDSPTERMRINNAGIMTQPYLPAFHAYGPSSATSGADVIYQNTYVNTGSHYSTTNGRFTAPVAGVYIFFWSAIGNSTNDVYRFHLRKNGSSTISGTANDIHLRQDTLGTGSEYATNGSRVQMLSLAKDDYVQIYYAADSGTGHYVQSDYSNFGGYLLG